MTRRAARHLHRRVRARPLHAVVALVAVVPLLALAVVILQGSQAAVLPHYRAPTGVSVQPVTSSTAVVDLTGVALPAVGGSTTQPAVRIAGRARIQGLVTGADSQPVPGAVVRVERLDGANAIDVATGADGRYAAEGIAGGRYRVRAFLAPKLAQTEAQVFFLGDGEDHGLDLQLAAFDDVAVTTAVAPDPPANGQPFNLAVRVVHRVVDSDGVVRAQPRPGAGVTLVGANAFAPVAPLTRTTGADGTVVFLLTCKVGAPAHVQVETRDGTAPVVVTPVDLTACVTPPTTTSTATTVGPSTTAPATTKPTPTTVN